MLIGRRELLRLMQAALMWRLALAKNHASADTLEECLAWLKQRQQDYRSSLQRLVAMHEAAAARTTAAAEQTRRLHAEGLVARREVDEAAGAAADAQARLDAARKQLGEVDGLMVEA